MATREYEALVILKATGTEQELAQSAQKLEEPIKKFGGRIESSQAWGRRKLAFHILRQTEGYYHLVRFAAPPERMADIRRLYRLNEAIVRFVILAQDETQKAAPAATAS